MRYIEKLIYLLFPTLLVSATEWYGLWKEKQRSDFVRSSRVILILISAVYVGHYFFFDKVVGLTPIEDWFKFRFGMAALCLLSAGFYYNEKLSSLSWYKAPMMLSLLAVCITQAHVSILYEPASYLFSCTFTYLAAVLLRSTVLKSLMMAGFILYIQYPLFLEAGVAPAMALSSCAVVLSMVAFSRTSYLAEIKYFVANQKNISSQKEIIQNNIEFTNQIKAFLPKEISRRLDFLTNQRRMTVIEATDEVLRPRKKQVSCIFTDIRGFTQGSKNLDDFVGSGVIPNVKECTSAIESLRGIQRKIGDLIFSYFDNESLEVNVLNSTVAGFEIVTINKRFNEHSSGPNIERFVLIASGEALVGNIGNFESSIEITALGSPVNFLSRLDDATKILHAKKLVEPTDVIMDKLTFDSLSSMIPNLNYKTIKLKEHDVSIKDFEEVPSIFAIPVTKENQKLIWTIFEFTEETIQQGAA